MQRGAVKGLITKADLAAYRVVWRDPLITSWNGFKAITAPPPSSGGIALMQMRVSIPTTSLARKGPRSGRNSLRSALPSHRRNDYN